jgi:hypothetical protein
MSLSIWITNLKVLAGMMLCGVSAIVFVIALKYDSISVLYPVIAISYVWVAVVSKRVLCGPLSLKK